MFQKLVAREHVLELRTRDKIVFASLPFTSPRGSRGIGDGEFQVRHNFANALHQRGFARSRGRRNDKYLRHSMFCTCSRAFSMSAFIPSPASVIFSASPARPAVFESRVLA